MVKKTRLLYIAVILIFSASCCLSSLEKQKRDYGMLCSIVTYASDKVIGVYDSNIPPDFDAPRFLDIAKRKLNERQYRLLTRYRLEISPLGTYYLLKLFDGKRLILFDYSCTIKLDGPILSSDKTFDLDHLEKYDECAKDKQKLIKRRHPNSFFKNPFLLFMKMIACSQAGGEGHDSDPPCQRSAFRKDKRPDRQMSAFTEKCFKAVPA
jgi:hypothetical protein